MSSRTSFPTGIVVRSSWPTGEVSSSTMEGIGGPSGPGSATAASSPSNEPSARVTTLGSSREKLRTVTPTAGVPSRRRTCPATRTARSSDLHPGARAGPEEARAGRTRKVAFGGDLDEGGGPDAASGRHAQREAPGRGGRRGHRCRGHRGGLYEFHAADGRALHRTVAGLDVHPHARETVRALRARGGGVGGRAGFGAGRPPSRGTADATGSSLGSRGPSSPDARCSLAGSATPGANGIATTAARATAAIPARAFPKRMPPWRNPRAPPAPRSRADRGLGALRPGYAPYGAVAIAAEVHAHDHTGGDALAHPDLPLGGDIPIVEDLL